MSMALFTGRAVDSQGNARKNVAVTVNLKSSGLAASVFSDNTGATAKDNPLTTSGDGSFSFYAADGDYVVIDDKGFTVGDATLYSGGARSYLARKLTGETVSASTALQDDDALKSTAGMIRPNETWDIKLKMIVTANIAAGFKFAFTIPAGGVFSYESSALWSNTVIRAKWSGALTATQVYTEGVAALATAVAWLKGTLVNGATAGTLQLQWASNAAVSTSRMEATSYLIMRRTG